MTKINNLSWIKFSIDNAGIEQILLLDSIHSNAVSVWMRAFAIIKIYGGNMELKPLLRSLTGHNISRKKVIEILEATGDFNIDKEADAIGFSDAALGKMTNASSGKNSLANALAQENFPKQTASNAHAIEIENKKENKNTLPSFSHETQSSSEPAAERVTQSWPKKPAELEAYRGELWHGYVCELFNQRQMQSWRETLMQQIYDKELVGLVERHWAETVMQFVYHLVTWPPSKGIWSIEDLKRTFHGYLRPNRAPSRELKAYLRQLEQQDTVKDDREQRFIDFMHQHFPHLLLMDDALTFEQFDQLRHQYGKQAVLTVLADMENDTSLERRSCFDTALQWLRYRHKS